MFGYLCKLLVFSFFSGKILHSKNIDHLRGTASPVLEILQNCIITSQTDAVFQASESTFMFGLIT